MTNIYNLFKFLEDKEGTKTPLKIKLITAPETLTHNELKVRGSLNLGYTKITSLPDGLKVEDYLDLSNTKITSLSDNLEVGGYLDLSNTKITSLPDNLKIEDDLYLDNTPLSKKYSDEQIRKIIEDKGGYIKGEIYI